MSGIGDFERMNTAPNKELDNIMGEFLEDQSPINKGNESPSTIKDETPKTPKDLIHPQTFQPIFVQ